MEYIFFVGGREFFFLLKYRIKRINILDSASIQSSLKLLEEFGQQFYSVP